VDFRGPIEAVVPGAQGRILGVLAHTTAELNLRTVARLADVSVAQASRVLPELVELGLVERREAPPSALFRLVREHVAATGVLALANVRERLVADMGRIADMLPVAPFCVIIFGSFARSEADRLSDIDTVLVRPADIDESDEDWAGSVDRWRELVGRASGNRVEVLEVPEDVIERRLRSGRGVWREIRRDGIVVAGSRLGELEFAYA
jgi:DNA-binding MarR family transcriptional regulator